MRTHYASRPGGKWGKDLDRPSGDLVAAYQQGQRDREQGWPVLNWGFTFSEQVAYHAGFVNPRCPVSAKEKA